MLFNSIEFLFFFPLTVIFFYITPNRLRWIVLLAASAFFYMYSAPIYILLVIFTTLPSYISGLLLDKIDRQNIALRRLLLFFSVLICLSALFVFKYYNFFIDSITELYSMLGMTLHLRASTFILPVGISFYTFQNIGYIIDVYRGGLASEKHMGYYFLYILFFPQLVAGPIERAENILPQLRKKAYLSDENIKKGLIFITLGFFKKLVIADRLAICVNTVYSAPEKYNGATLILATFFFAVQIYCDFSGYSDIATGAAKILDIDLMKNFDAPYLARGMRDFWARWHISLSSWFKDYVYIPLGGNRKGNMRTYINLMFTFLLSGFWHGANWTFVVWGALHGFYQVLERLFFGKKKHSKNKAVAFFSTIFTFILVLLAWVFFRADTIREAFDILIKTPDIFKLSLIKDAISALPKIGMDNYNLIISLISIIFIFILQFFELKAGGIKNISKANFILRYGIYCIMFASILFFGVYGSNEFIYFRF